MLRSILLALAVALVVLAAGCGGSNSAAGKRYPMQGQVKAIDAGAKSATIDAGKIGDWMEPMTMEYPVKPDSELQKLHVGDRIQATVVVIGPSTYYVTDIQVTK